MKVRTAKNAVAAVAAALCLLIMMSVDAAPTVSSFLAVTAAPTTHDVKRQVATSEPIEDVLLARTAFNFGKLALKEVDEAARASTSSNVFAHSTGLDAPAVESSRGHGKEPLAQGDASRNPPSAQGPFYVWIQRGPPARPSSSSMLPSPQPAPTPHHLSGSMAGASAQREQELGSPSSSKASTFSTHFSISSSEPHVDVYRTAKEAREMRKQRREAQQQSRRAKSLAAGKEVPEFRPRKRRTQTVTKAPKAPNYVDAQEKERARLAASKRSHLKWRGEVGSAKRAEFNKKRRMQVKAAKERERLALERLDTVSHATAEPRTDSAAGVSEPAVARDSIPAPLPSTPTASQRHSSPLRNARIDSHVDKQQRELVPLSPSSLLTTGQDGPTPHVPFAVEWQTPENFE